jgi:RHS repeat-associated protein
MNKKKRYAFGMEMPGRKWVGGEYRFAFNGKEKDREINSGSSNFVMREYDERLGRFFCKDLFSNITFNKSSYCFAGNSPIAFVDYNGGFQISPRMQRTHPQLNRVLKAISNIANDNPSLNNPLILAFMRSAGLSMDNNGLEEALQILSYGSGPIVEIGKLNSRFGEYSDGNDFITLDKSMIKNLERLNKFSRANNEPAASFLGAFLVTIHEGVHYADWETDGNTRFNAFIGPFNRSRNGFFADLGDYATSYLTGIAVRAIISPGSTKGTTSVRDLFDNNASTQIPGLSNLNFDNFHQWIAANADDVRSRNGNGFNYVNSSGYNSNIGRSFGEKVSKIIQKIGSFIKSTFGGKTDTKSRPSF